MTYMGIGFFCFNISYDCSAKKIAKFEDPANYGSKILKKITEKAKYSLETIATFDFRSENAIRFLENVFTQNSLDSIF